MSLAIWTGDVLIRRPNRPIRVKLQPFLSKLIYYDPLVDQMCYMSKSLQPGEGERIDIVHMSFCSFAEFITPPFVKILPHRYRVLRSAKSRRLFPHANRIQKRRRVESNH